VKKEPFNAAQLEILVRTVRNAALEEAALLCEAQEGRYESRHAKSVYRFAKLDCAKAIRAMKGAGAGSGNASGKP
jgi:hypothetical protein